MARSTRGKSSKPAFSAVELRTLKAKKNADILKAAKSDPDARPLNARQLLTIAVAQRIRMLRAKLDATQAEFAKTYRIPLGTLRDLEQGRTEGDAVMTAYVTLIEADPKGVARTLAKGSVKVRPAA